MECLWFVLLVMSTFIMLPSGGGIIEYKCRNCTCGGDKSKCKDE